MGSHEGDTRNAGTSGCFFLRPVTSYRLVFGDGKKLKVSAQEEKEILKCPKTGAQDKNMRMTF